MSSEKKHIIEWVGAVVGVVAIFLGVSEQWQTRQSDHLSNRAFVSFQPEERAATARFGIVGNLKNHGGTPAKDVRVSASVSIIKWPFTGTWPPVQPTPASAVIFPDDPLPFTALLDPKELPQLPSALSVEAENRVAAFIRVDYEDVYGEAHYTLLCLVHLPGVAGPQEQAPGVWTPMERCNKFT